MSNAPWIKMFGLVEPYGKCQCGCGEDAVIAGGERPDLGYTKGQPQRFALGHQQRRHRPMPPAAPDGTTRYIALTRGKFALVSSEDYEALSQYAWYAKRRGDNWYAVRNVNTDGGKRTTLGMHQVIGVKGADHKDGNGLNNKRDNLRAATPKENSRNRGAKKGSSSKYKGVSWYKRGQSWSAYITVDYKMRHLGRFATEEEAARAHDAAAIELHGEFAKLNFPATAAELASDDDATTLLIRQLEQELKHAHSNGKVAA